MTQIEKAGRFRALHAGPRILILPNAWDVASARIFEEAGFPAIGTTSAGVAFALGYPDGQRISRGEMLEVVGRIARAVAVPVTADVEAGYDSIGETVRAVVAAGAVGMNLEDVTGDDESTLVDIGRQVEKIKALREAASSAGVPLVLNARTDIYLMGIGDPATRFERSVERMQAYRRAGADCVFVPGVRDRETIVRLAREAGGPLNILAGPGAPPAADLERMGVARLSVGSGPMRATLGLVARIARELRYSGTYASIADGAMPYADVNRMLGR